MIDIMIDMKISEYSTRINSLDSVCKAAINAGHTIEVLPIFKARATDTIYVCI